MATPFRIMLAAWLLLPGLAHAQRALIEQALDEPSEFTIKAGTKLGDAITMITEQTGVVVSMQPEVMRLVPYGGDTKIKADVTVANRTLRRALGIVFSPLGMTFRVTDRGVDIVPTAGLACLGRTATWEELATLSWLSKSELGMDDDALAQLRTKVQFHVPVREGWPILSGALRSVGAGSGDEVLTIACKNLAWAWCPAGEQIEILAIEQMFRRRLQRPVNLQMTDRPILEVIRAVGMQVGVPVRVEPGALADLPSNIQNHLALNTSLQSAADCFDLISGFSGLGYFIDREGVLFYNALRAGQAQPAQTAGTAQTTGGQTPPGVSQADPPVAEITVELEDGRTMKWLIRASELPPDLRDRRQRDIAAYIESLRKKKKTPLP